MAFAASLAQQLMAAQQKANPAQQLGQAPRPYPMRQFGHPPRPKVNLQQFGAPQQQQQRAPLGYE